MIGSYQWYQKGVYINQIKEYIYPYYSVFVPTRREYLDLIVRAVDEVLLTKKKKQGITTKTKTTTTALTIMDVGIGTSVITSTVLLKLLRQQQTQKNSSSERTTTSSSSSSTTTTTRVIGTDINPAAIQCSKENLKRLGLWSDSNIELHQCNIFPPKKTPPTDDDDENQNHLADIIICNPPWIPDEDYNSSSSSSSLSLLDQAIYDTKDMEFLRDFLLDAQHYLKKKNKKTTKTSEVWLILSNLAELLGNLRTHDQLLQMISNGNLQIIDVYHTKPIHPKTTTTTTTTTKDNKVTTSKKKKRRRETTRQQQQKHQQDGLDGISKARANEVTSLYRLRLKE